MGNGPPSRQRGRRAVGEGAPLTRQHWFRRVLAATVGLAVLVNGLAAGAVRAAGIPFDVTVSSALLLDVGTGQVLYAKNIHEAHPPASLSKLMALLLIFEALKAGRARLEDPVRTSATAASMGGSQVWLEAGETRSLKEMIEAIAIASANDATVAVAEYLAGTEEAFVRAMNRRAQELGLEGTHFANSTGLPRDGADQNRMTAADAARIARELVTAHPEVLEYTRVWRTVFRKEPRFDLVNTNRLIQVYEGTDGLKTGHTTEAGWHLVATAKRGDRRLIAVLLQAKSDQERVEQAARLLDYGFSAFRPLVAVREGEKVGSITVAGGVPERVDVLAAQDLEVLAPRLGEQLLDRKILPAEGLQPPLAAGDRVGLLAVTLDGQELGRVPVVAATSVARAGLGTRILRWLGGLFGD